MQKTGIQVAGHGATSFKTGTLQQTENYRWNTADAVGKGATAVVYFGRHKDSGEVCAVKVFHERSSRHASTTRQREIDTLRSLRHANIVKLLALETESATGNEVLVMEYCSGGSLYSMLEQPQYAYGFPESEFLLFLRHIAEGMRYLRIQGYVHRDIKPGNIMCFVGDDGRSLYKLTDFGAARELQDDETFMSIYGTEEYLYPKMYEQAVLRRPGVHTFDSSVDLWSLGVTLYHVATGQLPFQPFGGRSNAATMHLITSEKPSGVISGVQKTLNGTIQWSSTLPDTCLLSENLKTILVSMLAGLLEMNAQKMWTFDQFYDTVTNLVNRIVLKLFSCCTSQLVMLYVEPTDTYAEVQEHITSVTDLPVSYQLILWHDKQLCDVIAHNMTVQSYPKPVINTKLFLFNKTSMENCDVKIIRLINFPTVIPEREHLEQDAYISRKCAAVAFRYCLMISIFIEQQKLVSKGEVLFRRYIKSIVWHAEWIVPEIRQRLEETQMHMDSFTKTFTLLLKLFNTLNSLSHVEEVVSNKVGTGVHIKETMDHLAMCLEDMTLKQFFEKILTRLNEITVYVDVLSKKINEHETERLRHVIGCTHDDHCQSKAESLKQKIMSVSSTMVKHRKYGDLHSHEHFIHKCEKQRLQEFGMTLTSLANDHCKRNLQNSVKSTVQELGNLTKHLTRTRKVEQNISTVRDSLAQLSEKLSLKEDRCRGIVEKLNEILEALLAKGKASSLGRGHTPGAEGKTQFYGEAIRPELRSDLPTRESVPRPGSDFYTKDSSSTPKRQRTELLDKLTRELMSLKTDSDELKHLVAESGEVMKLFLSETSNLHIEGSLDSDQRRFVPDDT
ncbi:hypothetical protein ACF0H5_014424 [Mactra antiquata]